MLDFLTKNKVRNIVILVLLSIVVQCFCLGSIAVTKRKNKENEAYIYGETIVNAIQLTMVNSLNTTESLKYFYLEHEEDFFDEFESVAANIAADNPIVTGLFIAPKGVIAAAYPKEIQASTIGFAMLLDPAQGPRAQLAVDTRLITVAGPHKLIEGGVGFIIRNPIYKGDEFVGFTISILDWNKFVDEIMENVGAVADSYKFAVSKDNPDPTAYLDEEGYLFRSKTGEVSEKVTISFDVPNDTWHLHIEPVTGWRVWRNMIPDIIMSVAFSSIAIALIMLTVAASERKKTIIAEQNENLIKSEYMKQLTEALDKAKKAEAAKASFLSKMSHDIRTPLNGIIGLIEIDDKHADDRKLIDENRAKAKVAANHLLSLISDVLELSKLEADSVQLAHEPFDVAELIYDVLTIAKMRAQDAGITLEHSKRAKTLDCKYVYGSPLHLRQLFINIIGNSIKYNKPKGMVYCELDVAARDEKNVTFVVTISDTGIGMSEEFMEHLFEPFAQERNDARSVYQGTGLGMTIVKNLVDKMNGKIQVRSKLGEGSTFTVTLPFEIASEDVLPKKNNSKTISIEGMNVLLAEDNDLNLEIATMILNDEGVKVTPARNGQEAVDIFRDSLPGTFDVILMDLMMPVMDGYEATRTIRKLNKEDAESIPIIAFTANAFNEDAQRCFEAGMNAHLSKPINIDELKRTLAKNR